LPSEISNPEATGARRVGVLFAVAREGLVDGDILCAKEIHQARSVFAQSEPSQYAWAGHDGAGLSRGIHILGKLGTVGKCIWRGGTVCFVS
jgi:hypothetical protein